MKVLAEALFWVNQAFAIVGIVATARFLWPNGLTYHLCRTVGHNPTAEEVHCMLNGENLARCSRCRQMVIIA